jgi:hypothetical protein
MVENVNRETEREEKTKKQSASMLLHPMYSHQKFILCIYSIELSFNVGKK